MRKTFILVGNDNTFKHDMKVAVAGIVFTLFGLNCAEASCDSFFANSLSEITTFECPTSEANCNVILMSNNDCQDKISEAFNQFCSKNPEGKELAPICHFISDKLDIIDAERVSINGNPEIGSLNIAFRLQKSFILSVTKTADTMDDDLVAFNILRGRQLVISDIVSIKDLSDYILRVQSKIA